MIITDANSSGRRRRGARAAAVSRVAAAALPEGRSRTAPRTSRRSRRRTGARTSRSSRSTAGPALAHEQRRGRNSTSIAEPVVHEIAPGMKANCGATTASRPARRSRCVEGDSVRIFVTNRLPEPTTIHWHGVLPAERHGRRRRADPAADPVRQDLRLRVRAAPSGTFMYHPHADEMAQMAMGMMGIIVVHPKDPRFHARRPRLRASCINAYDIDPGSYTPKVSTMLDFNLWTLEQPRVPRHRSRSPCARAIGCASASGTSR